MRLRLVIIVLVVATSFSCKKKEGQTQSTSKPAAVTTTGSATSGSDTFTNATSFHVIFTTSELIVASTVNPISVASGKIFFSGRPVSSDTETNDVMFVTSVKLNGRKIAMANWDYQFQVDTPGFFEREDWEIVGNSIIPSFKVADGGVRPAGLSAEGVPDTIKPSTGATFTLRNISNATWGYITINGDAGVCKVEFPVHDGENTIVITPEQSAVLKDSPSRFVSYTIGIRNSRARNIQDKNFQFIKYTLLWGWINIGQ